MNSSRTRRMLLLAITHLLAIAAGIILFRSVPALAPQAQASAAPAAAQGSKPQSGASASRNQRQERTPSASVHEAAWRALAPQARTLTRAERRRAQALILRDWIQADWRAALDTVIRENPMDSDNLSEFQDQFVRDPVGSWELIEQKVYGIRTDALRYYWIDALTRAGEDNPARQKLLASLPEAARQAIQKAH